MIKRRLTTKLPAFRVKKMSMVVLLYTYGYNVCGTAAPGESSSRTVITELYNIIVEEIVNIETQQSGNLLEETCAHLLARKRH